MVIYSYVVFIMLSGVCLLFDGYKRNAIALNLSILAFFYIIVVVGFRYYSAHDYDNYHYFHQLSSSIFDFYIPDQLKNYATEPLFLIVMSLSKIISNESWVFFLLVTIVTLLLRIYAISKITKSTALVFLISNAFLFVNGDFIQIRWSLAIPFLILSVYYFGERKHFLFLFFAIISIAIHNFCFLFVLISLLARSENFTTVFKFYFSISIIVVVISRGGFLMDFVLNNIPYEYGRLRNYTSTSDNLGVSIINVVLFMFFILNLFLIKKAGLLYGFLTKYYYLCLCSLILTINFPVVFGRVFYIAKFFEIVVFINQRKKDAAFSDFVFTLINILMFSLLIADLYARGVLYEDYKNLLF